MAHAMVAQAAYAFHVNRHVSGKYAEAAEFWRGYLEGDFKDMKKLAVPSLLLVASFAFADPERPSEPGGNVNVPKTFILNRPPAKAELGIHPPPAFAEWNEEKSTCSVGKTVLLQEVY